MTHFLFPSLLLLLCTAALRPLAMTLMKHDHLPFGKSGRVCTWSKERCLSTAVCRRHRCHCPRGTKGNGLVECVPRNYHLCTVTNNFILKGFGKSDDVSISYPCVTRLTAFVVSYPLVGRSCTFDVLGAPYPSGYTNKVLGFVVRVKLQTHSSAWQQSMPWDPVGTRPLLVLKVGASADGFYQHSVTSYVRGGREEKEEGGFGWRGWGKSAHRHWKGFDISFSFDTVNNFAIFEIPQCRTKIKLRPADVLTSGNNGQVPAITIQAPPGAIWDPVVVPEVKHSLCGTPRNERRQWRRIAQHMGVKLKRLAALHDTLLQHPVVSMFTTTYVACQIPPQTFSTYMGAIPLNFVPYLGPGRGQKHVHLKLQNRAISICGPLITDAFTNKCLLKHVVKNSIPGILFIFDKCLKVVCSNSVSSCLVVRVLLSHLPPHTKCRQRNLALYPLLQRLNICRGIHHLPTVQ